MQQRHHIALAPKYVWPFNILLAFGIIGALTTIDPVDFWWHLAIGRDITHTGSIPLVTNHSWILPPNTPFIYGSWLSEWLFYQLYQVGGLPLIVLARNLLLLTAYALVAVEAWQRSNSGGRTALAIGGAGLMTLNNLTVRPQMFAWVCFALWMLLLGQYRRGQLHPRLIICLPLLMVIWVNLHGTFAIGLGLLAIILVGETLTYMLGRPTQMERQRLGWFWLAGVFSVIAVVANPRGPLIVQFVINLAGHPAARQFVTEWQPPDLLAFPGIFVLLALVLATLGLARSPQRFDLTDTAVVLAMSWLAMSSIRNLIWFGMVVWPIAVGLLSSRQQILTTRTRTKRQPLLGYAGAFTLTILFLIVQPPFKAALALPAPFGGLGAHVPHGALLGASTPVQAVAWLANHSMPAHTRLFHEMRYGSYLIWALPQVRVYTDGRIELYSLEQWLQYRSISNGENAVEQLAQIDATHALLSQASQSELIQQLRRPDSGWRELYIDDQAVIFERIPERVQQ